MAQHVAVLAFPFSSHVMTLFNLVCRLAKEVPHLHFSFFQTAKSSFNAELPPNIKCYNVDDGIPLNHVLTGPPIEEVELFLKAAPESFKKSIELAVAETSMKVSYFIADAFLTFVSSMATDMNVPWIAFWISFPCSLSAHAHCHEIRAFLAKTGGSRSEDQALDFIPGLSVMRVCDLPGEILDDNSTLFSRMLSEIGNVLPEAAAIVEQFYQELDPTQTTNDLKSKFQNLLNVGSLSRQFPPPTLPASDSDETGCLPWLDIQKPNSVAYISFGTVASLPPTEVVELAEALEVSGISYIWSMKEHLKENLPNGFLERTRMQGKVVNWAPQAQVLAHPSVGVFVTHSGISSVIEALVNEVPMICRPFFGDQLMSAQMVEVVWGIGVRVESDVLTKTKLLKCLDLILSREEGMKMRNNIQALKQVIFTAAEPNGSATKDFKTLVAMISKMY